MQLAIGSNVLGATTAQARASELEEIETLVRIHGPRLFRFVAFSIGDEDLANTIVQDCFLKAYNARDSFRGECTVSTWLFGIANNLIRDNLRTKKRRFWQRVQESRIDVSEAADFLPSLAKSPESCLLHEERAMQVKNALSGLSVNQRRIFLLRFSEEMNPHEISALIGMPINTVKTHLRRALKNVRAEMGVIK